VNTAYRQMLLISSCVVNYHKEDPYSTTFSNG